ncbi:DUF935 domain-containing protein [Acetobacter pomorum]|uniref:DUF935 domain-containing protein n=1 Tax=Acetobacter pomorum TaxID=65959 RepID=UPI000507050E|nr:DUF935 family protein [Acetobacter pomorum]KGB22913.1 Mu-like prophage FluMu protein gp29 [Acetobacter pomorum]
MALLDQYGKPIQLSTLRQDVAGPTVLGSRSAISTLSMEWVNPAMVGDMLRAASDGDSQQWQEFCSLIEQKDLHYLGVLSTRKRTISQLPISVEAASSDPIHQKHADYVRDWVKKGILRAALFDMMDALAKGFSVLSVSWNANAAGYWPRKLTYRPQRWFDVSYQDGETVKMRTDAGSSFTPDIDGAVEEIGLATLPPYSCVVHKHPSWSGLTLHSGLTRAIAFNSLFKLFSTRDWGVFVENFGLPMRVGKYGPDSTDDDRNKLWQAVASIANVLGCMIPKGMELDFVEPKNGAGSNDVHERRCKWLDEQTSKAVLGQTGTTDARQGTHAAASVHKLVQDDIERADALLISHTANNQIIKPMIDMKFGSPPDGNYPEVVIGRPDEVPLAEITALVQNLGPQGLKVRADDIYARSGLTPPEDGDVVIGVTAQPQQPLPSRVLPPENKPPKDNPAHVPPPTNESARAPGADDPEQTELKLNAALGKLLRRHAVQKPALVDVLTQSLSHEAERGLASMQDAVRAEFEQATSLENLRDRLDTLGLSDDAFQHAMSMGLLMAELAGEAAMLESMQRA